MNIEFLQDYTGRETAMQDCKKGDHVFMPFALASELIGLGVAQEVDAEPKATKTKRTKQPLADGGASDTDQS